MEVEQAFAEQIYGCGFNVIFAGNTLKHMYVTEKCIGSSGLSIFGIDYQVRAYSRTRQIKSRLARVLVPLAFCQR